MDRDFESGKIKDTRPSENQSGIPKLDNYIGSLSGYRQELEVIAHNLQDSLSEENPVRKQLTEELQNITDNLKEIVDQAEYEEYLLAVEGSWDELRMTNSFLKFQTIMNIMTSVEDLPEDMLYVFKERFKYYKYYSNIPKEDLEHVGPCYLDGLKHYKFWEKPFIDLWGDATSLHWSGLGHITGPESLLYNELTCEVFMKMFDLLKEKLGARILYDYQIFHDGDISKIKEERTSAEENMYNFGYFSLLFSKFPSIICSCTVFTDLDAFKHDFNNSKSRRRFIDTALNASGEHFYLYRFKMKDFRENLFPIIYK